jgi:hypothetical protein
MNSWKLFTANLLTLKLKTRARYCLKNLQATLPSAILALDQASLIHVLPAIGSGNPHLTRVLTVKASSGSRPYVVADFKQK